MQDIKENGDRNTVVYLMWLKKRTFVALMQMFMNIEGN